MSQRLKASSILQVPGQADEIPASGIRFHIAIACTGWKKKRLRNIFESSNRNSSVSIEHQTGDRDVWRTRSAPQRASTRLPTSGTHPARHKLSISLSDLSADTCVFPEFPEFARQTSAMPKSTKHFFYHLLLFWYACPVSLSMWKMGHQACLQTSRNNSQIFTISQRFPRLCLST